MTSFFISLISLVSLLIIHELGHFLLAKKFGVNVEEFGVGYPPRIFGKKIGETIYSVNLIPFGAFVKMAGEYEKSDDPGSFSRQSLAKRIMIALGGVLSFWLIAIIILSLIFAMGAPVAVEDDTDESLVNPLVAVMDVAPDSPAAKAGIVPGDVIKFITVEGEDFNVNTISQVQELTQRYQGREMELTLARGEDIRKVSLVPRISPPQGEGAMGVALVKVAIEKHTWPTAFLKGTESTWYLTISVLRGYGQALTKVIKGESSGIQVVGPIGIFQMMGLRQQLGAVYFFNFLAVVSIHLAIFNMAPIPVVDGGRVLFMLIEAVRKKPIPVKLEQQITALSFAVLLILMIWVTVQDVARLF